MYKITSIWHFSFKNYRKVRNLVLEMIQIIGNVFFFEIETRTYKMAGLRYYDVIVIAAQFYVSGSQRLITEFHSAHQKLKHAARTISWR